MSWNSLINSSKASKFLILTILLLTIASGTFASSIEGIVYDQNRTPLVDVDVELKDETGRMRRRSKTNAVGRYRFTDLPDGWYFVKVFAFRYNLIDHQERVRVDTIKILGGIGNDVILQDFFLKQKKGALSDTETGVIFAQKVPQNAQDKFKEATELFGKKKRKKGMTSLVEAVNLFPKYYAALKRLGAELLYQKRPVQAGMIYLRAAEVNPKSSFAWYYAGLAFSRAGKDYYKGALVSLGKAQKLAGNDSRIPYEVGKIHRKLGNASEAEIHLVKAKKLADANESDKRGILMELVMVYSNDLKQYAKAADALESWMKITDQKKNEELKQKLASLKAKAAKQGQS